MGQAGVLGPGRMAEETTNKNCSYWEAPIQEARGNWAGSTEGEKSMASVCKETEYKRLDPLNLFWSLWGLLHAEWCLAHGKSITHYVLGMN